MVIVAVSGELYPSIHPNSINLITFHFSALLNAIYVNYMESLVCYNATPISDGIFDHGSVINLGNLSFLSTQPLESACHVCTLTNGSMALAPGSMTCSLNCSMNCQGLEDLLLLVCWVLLGPGLLGTVGHQLC